MAIHNRPNPWYREPWPWIVMSGPALVVVAGVVTTAIAVSTSDGLVADDYYKQGLGINRVIARDVKAQALGISAMVRFNDARDRVQVVLKSREAPPAAISLSLVHPTRAGADQRVPLAASAPGIYEGALGAIPKGLWHVRVEDAQAAWRVSGDWKTHEPAVTLEAGKL